MESQPIFVDRASCLSAYDYSIACSCLLTIDAFDDPIVN